MELWRELKHDQIEDGYMISSYGRIKTSLNVDMDPYEPSYHSTNGYDYEYFIIKESAKINDTNIMRLFSIVITLNGLKIRRSGN